MKAVFIIANGYKSNPADFNLSFYFPITAKAEDIRYILAYNKSFWYMKQQHQIHPDTQNY